MVRRGEDQWLQEQERVVQVLNMSLCGASSPIFGI